ncbi:hypothetical protein QFC19_003750 [Naganishia cerealis]|uniref:Uncharacterized protein n=1 Tax=Naganishia cerealis TaxID=610337 RepID=A0ACC2W1F9_9TREE|nr:hypothetical protein QFC19_003750 [Naganishia cerealis]
MLPLSVLTLCLVPLALASPLPPAPGLAPLSVEGNVVGDAYIVVLKNEAVHGLAALEAHLGQVREWDNVDPIGKIENLSDGTVDILGGIKHVYQPTSSGGHGYYGYSGAFTPSTLAKIRAHPAVAYVEHDQYISVSDPTTFDGSFPAPEEVITSTSLPPRTNVSDASVLTQSSAPWGLARISHRPALSLSTFTKYAYSSHALDHQGDVDVYVIDTGINIAHIEFEGRARWGKTIPSGAKNYDGNGHGSHCAGTIGSRKYGVHKGANLVAVKVLGDNGSGTLADVIAGIQGHPANTFPLHPAARWAAEDAAAKRHLALTGRNPRYKGAVGSMSLGGGKSQATDDAVNAAVDSGLPMAVAAGNDNRDACDYSPARAKKALTVVASTLGDERAYFSNWGTCTDIAGPGLNILSVWTGGNATTNVISGTSMATPHLAGLMAYMIEIYGSESFPALSPSELVDLSVLGGADEAELAALAAMETAGSSEEEEQVGVYSSVYNVLPGFVKPFLPSPRLVASAAGFTAPAPKKPSAPPALSPAQIKGLIVKLASKGMLTDVREGTPNLLAFNNATIVIKK